MLFVRPARLADLDSLERMASAAHPVLHSLPHNRAALAHRLALSEASFHAVVDTPGEEIYLFVLEESDSGQLKGTASITAAAGYAEPFYAFRNDALIHASRELKVNHTVHALTMSHELTGRSRLAGFYIDPSLQNDAAAHLLSRARMMYIAAHRARFAPEVFALLLGVTDDRGESPFWEAVGRKFFGRAFDEIEAISGGRSATFIAEVMPSYPLYVPLLPEAAQRILGEAAASALPGYRVHLAEGFAPDRFIDIFDAGPVLTAHVDRSASVVLSESRVVVGNADVAHDRPSSAVAAIVGSDVALSPYLVMQGDAHDFRCTLCALLSGANATAYLDEDVRTVLNARIDDRVQCVPLQGFNGEGR